MIAPDETRVQILNEALAALGEADSALSVRVLSRLALEFAMSDPARAESFAEQALDMARRVGDSEALASRPPRDAHGSRERRAAGRETDHRGGADAGGKPIGPHRFPLDWPLGEISAISSSRATPRGEARARRLRRPPEGGEGAARHLVRHRLPRSLGPSRGSLRRGGASGRGGPGPCAPLRAPRRRDRATPSRSPGCAWSRAAWRSFSRSTRR